MEPEEREPEEALWSELCKAVMSGTTATVERLLSEKAALGQRFDLSRLDSEGLTLLHQAIFASRLPMLRLLHKHGGDVSVRDEEGCTLLHTAAIIGNRLIAAWLIKEGANVAAVDRDGMLPLDRAEDVAMEELLVQAMARAGHVGLALPSEPILTEHNWSCLPNSDRDSDYGTSSSICSLSEDEERTSQTFDSSADEAGTDRESDVSSLASPGADSVQKAFGGQAMAEPKTGDPLTCRDVNGVTVASDDQLDQTSFDGKGKLVRVQVSDISVPQPQSAARQLQSAARQVVTHSFDSDSNTADGRMTRTTVEILWSKVRGRQLTVEKTFIDAHTAVADERGVAASCSSDEGAANLQISVPEERKRHVLLADSETVAISAGDKPAAGKDRLVTDEAIAKPNPETAGQSTSFLPRREADRESNSSDDTLLAPDHSDLELSVSEPDTSSPPVLSDSCASSTEKQVSESSGPVRTRASVESVSGPELRSAHVSPGPRVVVGKAGASEWAEGLKSTHAVIANRRKELREAGENLKSWSEQHRDWMSSGRKLQRQRAHSDDVFDPCTREQPIARKRSLLSRSLAAQQFNRPVAGLTRCHTLSEVDLGWVSAPHTQARSRVTARRKPLKSLLRTTSTVDGDQLGTPRPRKSVSFPVEVLLADAVHAGDVAEVERYLLSGQLRGKVLLDNGLTPLHLAVLDRQRAIVKLLLSNGVKVDQRDADGWTALHAAASEGTVPVTHLLLENGADPWAKTECDGKTAYELASNDNVRLVLSKAMGETSRQVSYLEQQSGSDTELNSGSDDEEDEVLSDDEDDGTQSDMDGADTDSIDEEDSEDAGNPFNTELELPGNKEEGNVNAKPVQDCCGTDTAEVAVAVESESADIDHCLATTSVPDRETVAVESESADIDHCLVTTSVPDRETVAVEPESADIDHYLATTSVLDRETIEDSKRNIRHDSIDVDISNPVDVTEVACSDDSETSSLYDLVAYGDIDGVRRAISADRGCLKLCNNEGWTLLHAAAAADEVAIACYLLDSGAQACVLDNSGQFPLQLCKSTEMVTLLEQAMVRSKKPTML